MRDRSCYTTIGETGPLPPRRKSAVIVDDGLSVSLVLLDDSQPATVGARFSHGGRMWVVSGVRPGSRVLVAEPDLPVWPQGDG
jgi:hypothetical protein